MADPYIVNPIELQTSLCLQRVLKCILNIKLLDLGSGEMAKWLKVRIWVCFPAPTMGDSEPPLSAASDGSQAHRHPHLGAHTYR